MKRPRAIDRAYIFEYDVGQWAFGTIQVLQCRETGALKSCKTVPKSILGRSSAHMFPNLKKLEQLQHPHVSTINTLEDEHCLYIISEFTEGGDVQDWMERLEEAQCQLQEKTCATYVRQLILGLTHCHALGIYHRDLRPGNLTLTSKLPDAQVKVSDFGLAPVLDPDNAILHRLTPSRYTAPEIRTSSSPITSGAPDMWSVGAIAHRLLVGRAPSEVKGAPTLLERMTGSRSEDPWLERSSAAKDFVQCLLPTDPNQRLSAVNALQHPWLKSHAPVSLWRRDNKSMQDIQFKTLCYMLSVLMIPVLVPHRDWEQLRVAFRRSDHDGDGFVLSHDAMRVIRQRCFLKEAVAAALAIADVGKTEVLDLCTTSVADLIAREFFAAGPTAAPLAGPFTASDLAPRMIKKFFETFGKQQKVVTLVGISSKLRTATARDVEQYCGVQYSVILDGLPEDCNLDEKILQAHLGKHAGRGTPLGVGHSEIVEAPPWLMPFGASIISLFQGCQIGAAHRSSSPHSLTIC